MNFKVESLKPKYMKQLYDMLWYSSPDHYEKSPSDFFKPYIEKDPFHFDDAFRVIMDGEKIVGTTKIFYRNTFINGEKLLLGGIGLVAVHPDYRGKKLAGLIMQDCVEYMEKNNFDVSLLFAGPIPLYKKYGWSSMKTKSWYFSNIDLKKISNNNLHFRPVNWNVDYADIYDLHLSTIKKYNLGIIRNPNYWNNYVWEFTAKKSEIWGVEKNNSLVSYAIVDYNKKDKVLHIKEFASIDDTFLNDLVYGLYNYYNPSFFDMSSTGKSVSIIKILEKISGKVDSSNEDGMMFRNINKNIDVESEEFNNNSLFFGCDSF